MLKYNYVLNVHNYIEGEIKMIEILEGKSFSNNTDYWMPNETFNELVKQATVVRLTDEGLTELTFEDKCNARIALKFGEKILGLCTKTGEAKTIAFAQVVYVIKSGEKVYEADTVKKTYCKDCEIL